MTTIKTVEDLDTAYELSGLLSKAPYAALDIETVPVPWYDPEYKLLTVAISIRHGEAWVIPVDHAESRGGGHRLLEIALEQATCTWVMQNGAFDYAALRAEEHYLTGQWHDTMAIQYLLDIDKPKGLEDLAKRWLGVPGWKDIDYKAPQDEDLETLALLNGRDADYTLQIFGKMHPVISGQPELAQIYSNLMRPAMRALADMELSGIPIDADRLADLTAEVEDRLEDTLEDIREMAGNDTFNPNSVKQMQKLLYGKFGLPVFVFTNKGAPSTNAESLQKLENLHPIIPLIQRFRTDRKLLTASLRPWAEFIDAHGYMHPRYKPAHVRTGRLASEKPNIQQVPRDGDVRRLFGGVEGHQIVEMDYSQLELRIVAELAGEENMLAAFHAGDDLHQRTAEALGVDRQTGKTANFGLLYGAGYRKLRDIAAKEYGVVLTESQAMMIREGWFAAYPAIADFHEACKDEAKRTGQITSPIGRRRPLPDIYSTDYAKEGGAIRQALNTPVQSLASDITLLMVTELWHDYQVGAISAVPVATVHDSILFLVPDRTFAEDTVYIQDRMENPPLMDKFGIELGVPLLVDMKANKYWGSA